MKVFYFLFLLSVTAGCNQNNSEIKRLEERIDTLENRVDNSYKPGFGEFMSGIQVHHAKLWFAGINNNWELAAFELNEIREALDDLNKYEKERKELKALPMIYPALDSLNNAITERSAPAFKSSFFLLTNTCNSCHQAVNYSFNKVVIPGLPPFSNQVFEKNK